MPITRDNVRRHELIGLNAKISDSKNSFNVGIQGRIVNETHHTLQIRTKNGDKRVFKSNVVLEVELPSGEKVEIIGTEIEKRPWDRLKK